jgi:hypothetical protein
VLLLQLVAAAADAGNAFVFKPMRCCDGPHGLLLFMLFRVHQAVLLVLQGLLQLPRHVLVGLCLRLDHSLCCKLGSSLGLY